MEKVTSNRIPSQTTKNKFDQTIIGTNSGKIYYTMPFEEEEYQDKDRWYDESANDIWIEGMVHGCNTLADLINKQKINQTTLFALITNHNPLEVFANSTTLSGLGKKIQSNFRVKQAREPKNVKYTKDMYMTNKYRAKITIEPID